LQPFFRIPFATMKHATVRFRTSPDEQGEFKNRRKSRCRQGNEAEVFFAPKSASSRRRLPFLNTACLATEIQEKVLSCAEPGIMYCIVASNEIQNPLNKMKTNRAVIVGVCLLAGIVRFVLTASGATASEANVLEMNSAPNGHFLVNLQIEGRDRLVNIEVKDNAARCVNSEDARMKGLQGTFQLIGNGVFLIFFQNQHHRASQFWVFRKDGSAAVKEIPDRGEKQTAVPVKDESLEAPKADR
jgi:hypothetical protein